MSSLFYFLTNMAIDPKKQEMFEKNPGEVLETAGLSEVDKIRLKSGDRAKLTAAFGDELETHELMAILSGCFGSDPGPDPTPDPDPLPE